MGRGRNEQRGTKVLLRCEQPCYAKTPWNSWITMSHNWIKLHRATTFLNENGCPFSIPKRYKTANGYNWIRIHSPCFERRLQSKKCPKIAPRTYRKQGLFLSLRQTGRRWCSCAENEQEAKTGVGAVPQWPKQDNLQWALPQMCKSLQAELPSNCYWFCQD